MSYHLKSIFQSESTLYKCLNVNEIIGGSRHHVWRLSDCNETRSWNHLVCKGALNHSVKLAKWLSWVVSNYLYGTFVCICSYHVRYEFPNKSTLYKCLNVKEILVQSGRQIWRLSDWNESGSHNDLVRNWTPSHLAQQIKWLSCVLSSYLYGAFVSKFSKKSLLEVDTISED